MKTSSYVRSYGGLDVVEETHVLHIPVDQRWPPDRSAGGRARTSLSHAAGMHMPRADRPGWSRSGVDWSRILQRAQRDHEPRSAGRTPCVDRVGEHVPRGLPVLGPRLRVRPASPYDDEQPLLDGGVGPDGESPRQSASASQLRPNQSGSSRARAQRSMRPGLVRDPVEVQRDHVAARHVVRHLSTALNEL